MDLVARLVRALLLPALLLAVLPCPGVAKELCPEPCHCPQHGHLDCQDMGLATVPPASRHWPLTILDFTGNSIAGIGKQTWKDYPWTETLVLRDNELQAVKSHSLEGLFLLKHLDLSCNEILSIEEQAFESLPFLKLLNLSGNGLTQIRSSTFQAWHGMEFLQELILSHNPLALIADTAFFKLPSVSSLDLSATQVPPQTLLLLLQTTLSLETLQVPKKVACCLCQERPLPETPCRRIQFLCEKLCSASAPHCGHTSQKETWGEIMDMEQPPELDASPVLRKHKKPLVGDHGTVILALVLTQSTEGDVSSLHDSRSNSYPTQHLSGRKGKTSVDDLMNKLKRMLLKKKLHKSKSTRIARSIIPYPAQLARLKDVVEKTPSSWDLEEMESRSNWQGLNPSDVAGGLNRAYLASITGQDGDEEEDAAPRKNYVSAHKRHRKEDSHYGVGHSSLGGHPLIFRDTREEEDSTILNKPWSPRSPDLALVSGELLETTLDDQQQLLEPDKGMRMFTDHVERALRRDCNLPQLKEVCAKMVSKTRLLLNLLSERQENQGASDHRGHCRVQENMIIHMALGKGKKLTRKKLEVVLYVITSVFLLAFFIIAFLILKCISQKRSRPCDPDCQPCHTRTFCLGRFCVGGRKDNKQPQDAEQKRAGTSSQCCPSSDTVNGPCQCCSLFKKSELAGIQRIRTVYEAQI
ncbi:leucine-rich repeat-containing protein 37A3-like [Oenanthe melanoleuca]|uniref:leucine-rich repeat-containing protein 37A3-like n=1 Tax=Oenanthe melanoleuca TaxID=2939378 RepID=UPI0024C11031|nr:leucine-rich repeat-containing protein 37A3-like [Oenanthe melanoleuca]